MNVGKWMAGILVFSFVVDVFDGSYPKLHFVGVAATLFVMALIIHHLVKPYGQKQVCNVVMWATFFNLIDELFFDPTSLGINDYICVAILISLSAYRYKKYKNELAERNKGKLR